MKSKTQILAHDLLCHGSEVECQRWDSISKGAIYDAKPTSASTGAQFKQLSKRLRYRSPVWEGFEEISLAERIYLSGRIEVDDAYLGGQNPGGKTGRGSKNKVPFVAAVEANDQGHPMCAVFAPVKSFNSAEIAVWACNRLRVSLSASIFLRYNPIVLKTYVWKTFKSSIGHQYEPSIGGNPMKLK